MKPTPRGDQRYDILSLEHVGPYTGIADCYLCGCRNTLTPLAHLQDSFPECRKRIDPVSSVFSEAVKIE